MWVVYLEIGLALGLAIFIVWFTWPKREDDDKPVERKGPGTRDSG